MNLKITILIGTMTGTAQLVAEEIESHLSEKGVDISTKLMDGLDYSVFENGGHFIICTSTYGQGDVPDNAQMLFDSLKTKKPKLSNVNYGVFGLGDSTYSETFGFGGKNFDLILSELGAKRLGSYHVHDASSNTLPEDEALPWIDGWIDLALNQ